MNTCVEKRKDTYANVLNEDFYSIANAICESFQNRDGSGNLIASNLSDGELKETNSNLAKFDDDNFLKFRHDLFLLYIGSFGAGTVEISTTELSFLMSLISVKFMTGTIDIT